MAITAMPMVTFAVASVPILKAQSEQENAIVKSFNKTVADFVPTHIQQSHPVEKVGCGWKKLYFEPSANYRIDVQKTNSIVSPYLGVVEFNVIRHDTKCHKTQAEAEKDDSFSSDVGGYATTTHKDTFVYQEKMWVLKYRELYNTNSDIKDLYQCKPMYGCID
jgi:hypothetical protein